MKAALYSTTLHVWEVWHQSRPLGHGTLSSCMAAHPDALVSDRQRELAEADLAITSRGRVEGSR